MFQKGTLEWWLEPCVLWALFFHLWQWNQRLHIASKLVEKGDIVFTTAL
jgi:hypothetical protein